MGSRRAYRPALIFLAVSSDTAPFWPVPSDRPPPRSRGVVPAFHPPDLGRAVVRVHPRRAPSVNEGLRNLLTAITFHRHGGVADGKNQGKKGPGRLAISHCKLFLHNILWC